IPIWVAIGVSTSCMRFAFSRVMGLCELITSSDSACSLICNPRPLFDPRPAALTSGAGHASTTSQPVTALLGVPRVRTFEYRGHISGTPERRHGEDGQKDNQWP